jgi:hypothetical protein
VTDAKLSSEAQRKRLTCWRCLHSRTDCVDERNAGTAPASSRPTSAARAREGVPPLGMSSVTWKTFLFRDGPTRKRNAWENGKATRLGCVLRNQGL